MIPANRNATLLLLSLFPVLFWSVLLSLLGSAKLAVWVQWKVIALVFMLGYRAPMSVFTCCEGETWWTALYWGKNCSASTTYWYFLNYLAEGLKYCQEKCKTQARRSAFHGKRNHWQTWTVEEVSKTWLTSVSPPPPHLHTPGFTPFSNISVCVCVWVCVCVCTFSDGGKPSWTAWLSDSETWIF